MATTIAQLPTIPASTPTPSASMMRWTAEALVEIGFKPEAAHQFGCLPERARALESAMRACSPWTP